MSHPSPRPAREPVSTGHRTPASRPFRWPLPFLTDRMARPAAPGAGPPPTVDRRVVLVSGLAMVVAVGAGLTARILTWLIGAITNLAFHGRLSAEFSSPAGNHLARWSSWCRSRAGSSWA